MSISPFTAAVEVVFPFFPLLKTGNCQSESSERVLLSSDLISLNNTTAQVGMTAKGQQQQQQRDHCQRWVNKQGRTQLWPNSD